MQDNISCALITAFERQYDTSWDDPKLRNERLAMRYGWTAAMEAKQCLHQIQEPAAAEQAAWHAGLDEGRAQEAPAAVAVPTQALTGEARAEKIRGLAPIRAKLSAAADVAVPDGWHAPGLGEVHNEDHTQMIYCADGDGVASDDLARKVRAALAATPAPDAQVPQGSYVSTSGELKPDVSVYSTPAAAPVVLPEPDAVISELMGLVDEWGMESHLRGAAELDAQHSEATQEEIDCAKDRTSKERAAWKAIESKLRALLATATGLPAQAVAYIDSEVLTSFLSSSNYRPADGWDCHIRHQENKRDTDVPLYSRPQAQADARDAALAASEQDALRLVRQAVRDFHYALDNRKHGGVAAGAAMNAIEMALNMYWQQGQEADRRASLAAQGGE
ncbi:hypothetical protein FSY59_00295 [Comamonas sp. Z3]|uniref:hypothetical protein n=1 Tax=Comamonas sp. Z3 TaxID=2601247 RepID=UPI0011E7851C|nr:hypothetical protein [Comamonas sp. Z3]TYK73137.1 hypothetical protein FSY59_00295 [Comamonas sp. Z3]